MMKHGRWNYRRLSKVVLFFYYKNMLLPFTVFFFSVYVSCMDD
jgi:magnesium-transporting ATPase (P-type)